MIRLATVFATSLGLIAGTACNAPFGRECGTYSSLTVGNGSDVTMKPGDRATLLATFRTSPAYMDESGTGDDILYTSESRPTVFRWGSTDTTVVTVTGGTLLARAPGVARVRVTSADQADSVTIRVVASP